MINLSIGIPVYNQVTTIRETIESVLSQNLKPYEIVISDNHCNDGTSEIIAEYKDLIRIVKPPVHLSIAAHWNFCVNQCAGNWVGLISGDDLLYPNYTKAMINGILKHKDSIFIMGGWNVHNKVNKTLKPHYLLSMGQVTHPPKTTKMLLTRPKASFAAFCFNKKIFVQVGGYDERFYLYHDWMLQYDFSLTGGIFIKLNEIIAEYTIDSRPVIENARILLHVEDQINYLTNKLWKAKNIGVKPNYIIKSGTIVFKELLCFISKKNLELKSQDVSNLKEIAIKLESINLYDKWLNQGILPTTNNRTKSFISKIARNTYNYFHNI